MPPHPGLRASIRYVVTSADTALALGSGDVPVLGTPRVLALMEQATVAALSQELEPGQTSVGVTVAVEHVRATPVGGTVDVEAVLASCAGRRLTFGAGLTDGDGVAATGEIVRVVVDRARFCD